MLDFGKTTAVADLFCVDADKDLVDPIPDDIPDLGKDLVDHVEVRWISITYDETQTILSDVFGTKDLVELGEEMLQPGSVDQLLGSFPLYDAIEIQEMPSSYSGRLSNWVNRSREAAVWRAGMAEASSTRTFEP